MTVPAAGGSAPITGGCAAVLLAGGRGSRMGGVDKPLLEVGGSSLLAIAVDAARALRCAPIVVAGPRSPLPDAEDVAWVREQPALSGPAAGIVAALAAVAAPVPAWTLVLACDLPSAREASAALRAGIESLPEEADGRCLELDGRAQWLCGLYRTAALRAAAASLPERGAGSSVRALMSELRLEAVDAGAALAADVDTWHDLEQARARADAARPAPGSLEEAP